MIKAHWICSKVSVQCNSAYVIEC